MKMNRTDYALTFACYNQVDFTRRFIQSLVDTGVDLKRVVAVDNGSTDSTRQVLNSLDLGGCLFNKSNLGCGVAWNQGILALQAEWTVVMNNDVLGTPGWLDSLIDVGIEEGLGIVSPAMIEGSLDYDIKSFAQQASVRMKNVLRPGARHAVCLAVHESVWREVGFFRPVPKLFGYEDTIFFNDARKAGIETAMTGASWLHHFGSITLSAMKKERGLTGKQGLGNRNLYRLLNMNWPQRKILKIKNLRQTKSWRKNELDQFGMTLHGLRKNGCFEWL